MIHLRNLRTPAIQFKTLCGYFISQMHISEKWTTDPSKVNCPECNGEYKTLLGEIVWDEVEDP